MVVPITLLSHRSTLHACSTIQLAPKSSRIIILFQRKPNHTPTQTYRNPTQQRPVAAQALRRLSTTIKTSLAQPPYGRPFTYRSLCCFTASISCELLSALSVVGVADVIFQFPRSITHVAFMVSTLSVLLTRYCWLCRGYGVLDVCMYL